MAEGSAPLVVKGSQESARPVYRDPPEGTVKGFTNAALKTARSGSEAGSGSQDGFADSESPAGIAALAKGRNGEMAKWRKYVRERSSSTSSACRSRSRR